MHVFPNPVTYIDREYLLSYITAILMMLPCSNTFFLPWVHIINCIDITAVHLVSPNMTKSLGQLLMQLSGNIKCLHSCHFCEVLEFQLWKVGEIHSIVTVKTFCILKPDSKHR